MTAYVSVPTLAVEVGGTALDLADTARLIGCRVSQRSGTPDQAELEFVGAPPRGAQPGAALNISAADAAAALFAGQVSAIEHDLAADGVLVVRVRGYDKLHSLRCASSVRLWRDTTVAGIAGDIAGAHGLKVEADADGPALPRILQRGESDLDLLTRLAARAGLGLHLRHETLHLFDLGRGIGDEMELTWGSSLRSATVDQNPSAGPRPITVQGQDIGGLGPADALRHVADAPPDASGAGELVLPGAPVLGAGDPEALARAVRRRQQSAAWVLRGTAAGDPRLRPGASVRLAVGAAGASATALARSFVLTEAVHTFDDSAGFATRISSAMPASAPGSLGGNPAIGGPIISIATVTAVDDPEGAGRVMGTLDAYDGTETAWLPVLTPSAGSESGLIAQPDVGARVLVLSTGLDPGSGVVIGALYTGRLPEDSVAEGRIRRSFWRSAGGQRISLDDVDSSLTLVDAGGSSVRLQPELVALEAKGDLHLSAPGRAIVITAASVDFVEG